MEMMNMIFNRELSRAQLNIFRLTLCGSVCVFVFCFFFHFNLLLKNSLNNTITRHFLSLSFDFTKLFDSIYYWRTNEIVRIFDFLNC